MDEDDLLQGETIEREFSPHPLSFMTLQSLCLFLMIWGAVVGWLVNFSGFSGFFTSSVMGPWMVILVWGLVMLLVSIAASLVTIRWTIFFIYLAIVAIGGIVTWQTGWDAVTISIFIPFYTVAAAIIGFLIVEIYRRTHKYTITNLRIIFKGGIITKHERSLRYNQITEIAADQTVLGQIFGFGTINAVSASGFGMGADQSFAAGGVEAKGKRGGLFGLFGGGREVKTPRSRTYYELHGAYPYNDIKKEIETLVQGDVITPYQQQQVELQQQQLDIQKQMKTLLKTGVDEEQPPFPPRTKSNPSKSVDDDGHWYPPPPGSR